MSVVGRTRACDGTVARAVMVSHNRKVVVETRKKKGKRCRRRREKGKKNRGRSG